MNRVSVPVRRMARKGKFLHSAMALAVACGVVVASSALAPAAQAQEYSKEWRTVAAPVSDAVTKAEQDEAVKALIARIATAQGAEKQSLVAQADAALGGVKSLLPTLIPAAKVPDDVFATGQFHLNIGTKFGDLALQRTGLKMMVDSGRVSPAQAPLLNYYVGSISSEFNDYAMAREYLQKAYDLGHKTDNVEQLLAETYFEQNQIAEGLALVDRMEAERGPAIPRSFYLRGLEVARDGQLTEQTVRRAASLVRNYPTSDNWRIALQVLLESVDFTADESLEVFRLMRLTDSMREARSFVNYIEAADVNRMANEVKPVLEQGIALGLLNAEDAFVKEAIEVVERRASEDREAADEDAAIARAETDAVRPRAAADNYLSIENFAGAEALYKLSLQRAPEDADRLNMRIGLVQARQGKFADARASFQAVKGKRAYAAAMWLAWIDTQASS